MNENKKLVPIRRFKEFQNSDDWEQRKLYEIAELTSSKRVHAEDYVASGIPFYRGKEISELRVHKPVSEVLYITEEKYEEMSRIYGSPKINDLLITAVGTLGNTWVVDNLPFYFKDGNLIWFKNIKCNSRYLDYVLSTAKGQKKIMDSAIGSNQKALTMVKLNELRFMFPKEAEQDKIATYFTNLDNLITLHQRKLEKMKALKAAYLSEMFPVEGERKPKRRFKGFTNAWEQRKLGDVCAKITDGAHFSPSEVDEGYPMPSVKDMMQNGFDMSTSKKISKENYELLCRQGCKPEIGDVVVAKDGSMLKYAFEIQENQELVILSSIAIMRPNFKLIDEKFLAHHITKPDFKKKVISENTTGTGVPRIVLSNFKNIYVSFPSKAEQEKIGNYFQFLDNLITLHQRKLEKLQNIKTAYLNEMFVGGER